MTIELTNVQALILKEMIEPFSETDEFKEFEEFIMKEFNQNPIVLAMEYIIAHPALYPKEKLHEVEKVKEEFDKKKNIVRDEMKDLVEKINKLETVVP